MAFDIVMNWQRRKNTKPIMRGGTQMSDFKTYRKKQLGNSEFREEYEAMRPEFEITRALIAARTSENLTQKELSEKSGIRQSNISRIESGVTSPTVATLEALAAGMGKRLVISFESLTPKEGTL